MRQFWTSVAGVALVMLTAGVAVAQPLGDVAKKEEARRKQVAKAGKVYTNESLRGSDMPGTDAQPPALAAAAPPSPSGAQARPEDKAAQEKAADPRKDEAHWRARMSELRTGLERARMFRDALQSRINALSTDFAARDDPAQRDTIAGDRAKALAEMDRVTKEIAEYEKAIRDTEEEARKAGVPPGWLR